MSPRVTNPLLTCVRVETDSSMEPLPCLEHLQCKCHLGAVSARVDLAESMLEVHPETDLLQSRTAGGISLQSSHLYRMRGWGQEEDEERERVRRG